MQLNIATGKSKVVKRNVFRFLGVFDDVMIMETTGKVEDEWHHTDTVLLNRITGEKIVTLGKVSGWNVKVDNI